MPACPAHQGLWCPQIFTEEEPDLEEVPKANKGAVYKKINWLRAGILSCDKLLTVSPNYATEISANPQGGAELDDVIRWVLLSLHTPCRAQSLSKMHLP